MRAPSSYEVGAALRALLARCPLCGRGSCLASLAPRRTAGGLGTGVTSIASVGQAALAVQVALQISRGELDPNAERKLPPGHARYAYACSSNACVRCCEKHPQNRLASPERMACSEGRFLIRS